MSDDLQTLTEAASRGDREALDALLARYLPELRAYIRLRSSPLIRARESSSDLVQTVCREVIEHMERFKYPSESAFKQWLFATALRKILNRRDYYLAQKRDALREVPMEARQSGDADALLACYHTFSTPSRRAMAVEEIERIESAFERLSADQREVITLAHLVGLSRKEIAEQMGKTEVAVRVLLHRALAKVADVLAPPDDD